MTENAKTFKKKKKSPKVHKIKYKKNVISKLTKKKK